MGNRSVNTTPLYKPSSLSNRNKLAAMIIPRNQRAPYVSRPRMNLGNIPKGIVANRRAQLLAERNFGSNVRPMSNNRRRLNESRQALRSINNQKFKLANNLMQMRNNKQRANANLKSLKEQMAKNKQTAITGVEARYSQRIAQLQSTISGLNKQMQSKRAALNTQRKSSNYKKAKANVAAYMNVGRKPGFMNKMKLGYKRLFPPRLPRKTY